MMDKVSHFGLIKLLDIMPTLKKNSGYNVELSIACYLSEIKGFSSVRFNYNKLCFYRGKKSGYN